MPPHPEGGCGGGYRVAVTVDHLGGPTAGPFGQHRPRSDSLQLLVPRVDLTVRFRAAPAPLTDTQHRRTARHRQIPDQGPGSAMTDRPGPTPRASHELAVALGEQPQFAVDDLLSADHQPGQAHQSSGAAATLNNGQGLPFCRRSIRRMTGPLPASWDYRISLGNSQRPTLQRDEPG